MMKISKSLLSAIAAGIVMTAATSCDNTEVIENERGNNHGKDCPTTCTSDHSDRGGDDGHTWNCPACGMG